MGIVEFISKVNFDWPTWLGGLLLGAIVGYFVSVRMEHVKRSIRLREQHLEDLKSAVLKPFLVQLQNFYIRTCKQERGIVIRIDSPKEEAVPISDAKPIDRHFVLAAGTLEGYTFFQPARAHVNPGHIEGLLRFYDDARANHFPELLGCFEKFTEAFNGMAKTCLEATQDIEAALKRELELPELGANFPSSPPWASYQSLAIFIYQRKLGMSNTPLTNFSAHEAEKGLSVSGTHVLHTMGDKDVKVALEVIEKLIGQESPVLEQAKHRCEELSSEANRLSDEFRQMLVSQKLPAKCPLI